MKNNTLTILVILLALSGCGKDEKTNDTASKVSLPEVNAENCEKEKIGEMSESIREKFAMLCVRRSDAKQSKKKEW